MRPSGLLAVCRRLKPDLVLLDLERPAEALEALEALMAAAPAPVLLLVPEGGDRAAGMKGLVLGALDWSRCRPARAPSTAKALVRQAGAAGAGGGGAAGASRAGGPRASWRR